MTEYTEIKDERLQLRVRARYAKEMADLEVGPFLRRKSSEKPLSLEIRTRQLLVFDNSLH
jgi:hypothetical protein